MMLLSDFLEAEVKTKHGESLGRVHDVRVEKLRRRSPEGHRLKVIGLVIGGRGIFDRELIEWDRVIEVDAARGFVLVRNA